MSLFILLYIIYDMKLESDGILIAIKPFNERDALGRIFTRDNGILVGMLRGAIVAKKNIPLIGQVGLATWNARLDSQLGVFHWDAEKNIGAKILLNSNSLMFMNAAFDLLNTLLPEREAYVDLYNDTLLLLDNLASGNTDAYLQWEISLLRELGYALDLSNTVFICSEFTLYTSKQPCVTLSPRKQTVTPGFLLSFCFAIIFSNTFIIIVVPLF